METECLFYTIRNYRFMNKQMGWCVVSWFRAHPMRVWGWQPAGPGRPHCPRGEPQARQAGAACLIRCIALHNVWWPRPSREGTRATKATRTPPGRRGHLGRSSWWGTWYFASVLYVLEFCLRSSLRSYLFVDLCLSIMIWKSVLSFFPWTLLCGRIYFSSPSTFMDNIFLFIKYLAHWLYF